MTRFDQAQEVARALIQEATEHGVPNTFRSTELVRDGLNRLTVGWLGSRMADTINATLAAYGFRHTFTRGEGFLVEASS